MQSGPLAETGQTGVDGPDALARLLLLRLPRDDILAGTSTCEATR